MDNSIQTTTIKIRKDTLRNLRHVRAYADESMIDILDRLVTQELKRYQVIEQKDKDLLPAVRSDV